VEAAGDKMNVPVVPEEDPKMSGVVENGENRSSPAAAPAELAPPDYCDPVVEAYKKAVDRTLLRENLKLTVEERFLKFEQFMECVYELREAGRKARAAR
jgi:hypothetical protein